MNFFLDWVALLFGLTKEMHINFVGRSGNSIVSFFRFENDAILLLVLIIDLVNRWIIKDVILFQIGHSFWSYHVIGFLNNVFNCHLSILAFQDQQLFLAFVQREVDIFWWDRFLVKNHVIVYWRVSFFTWRWEIFGNFVIWDLFSCCLIGDRCILWRRLESLVLKTFRSSS